ncbi:MAG: hypothetical protein HY367_02810 [Candidatus Aenigmarchaeota archaeon]|nr:hypothetical protein [Candidatus Aenigmarchaeota archaeon]
MDIDECFRKGLIKRARPDEELVKSLVEMAGIKETAVNTASVNELNISAYVSLAYDALREVLEAICISKGYKVLSHICIGELLKRELEDSYAEFDRLRYIRNGINYYGVKVEFGQGREIITKIFQMKKALGERYLGKFM